MSYRFRPVKLFRTGYRWWLDRAEYVVASVEEVTCWILGTGFWVDSCTWNDDENWND